MKPLFLSLLLTALLLSCSTTADKINVVPETVPENPPLSSADVQNVQSSIKRPEDGEQTKEEILRTIIRNMTLEEKIGQLFILQIRYNGDGSPRRKVDEELSRFLQDFKPGGIILFRENIGNNKQVKSLISDLQSLSDIPLFISVDEEGGFVSRLGKVPEVDVTLLPPALSIGDKNNPELAYNTGLVLGRELRALGVNMDMAPVADVNTNPDNPVIGNRAYSSNPITAGKMVVEVIRGFHKYDIASVIKHFPGHGDTSFDTHVGTVVLPFSRDRLDAVEFIPFELGIKAGTDAIMTAHIVMSGISSLPLPATLNPEIITDIIRKEFGFDGLVISDALEMGAIRENYTPEESAVAGIKAGLDILLMPENQISAFKALIDAVQRGEISEKRIEESVYRILRTKYERRILSPEPAGESIEDVQNDPAHLALIQTFLG